MAFKIVYFNLDDMWFSNSLRLQCEAEFAARKGKENFVEYEFKEYKGKFILFWNYLGTKSCSYVYTRDNPRVCLTTKSDNSRSKRGTQGST